MAILKKKYRVPQTNGLHVFVEWDDDVGAPYVGCNGERIGFRFPGDQKWTIGKPGYQVSGGVNDRGFYDDLIVERPLQS